MNAVEPGATLLARPDGSCHPYRVLFDAFDMIRIINLTHRTDRRADMLGELRKVGLEGDPRVSFFNACSFDDAGTFRSKGERGVFHSHLAILEEAAANGRSVLILEDDVDFDDAVVSYRLPKPCSIFYGSYSASNPDDLAGSDITGAHFMGFDADAAKHVADYLNKILRNGDQPPIDGAYVWFRRAYPKVLTQFAQPILGDQRPSRSDIADVRFFDALPGLREAASLGRRIKRYLGRHHPPPAEGARP